MENLPYIRNKLIFLSFLHLRVVCSNNGQKGMEKTKDLNVR